MQDDLLLGGGIPSVGPKTDPRNYETIKCDKCVNTFAKKCFLLQFR